MLWAVCFTQQPIKPPYVRLARFTCFVSMLGGPNLLQICLIIPAQSAQLLDSSSVDLIFNLMNARTNNQYRTLDPKTPPDNNTSIYCFVQTKTSNNRAIRVEDVADTRKPRLEAWVAVVIAFHKIVRKVVDSLRACIHGNTARNKRIRQ